MADVEFNLAKANIELPLSQAIVGGGSFPKQILNLVRHLEKRGFLEYLEQTVREHRPGLFKELEDGD